FFMDTGILEIRSLFDTFAEACAAIKNYVTKTNTVLILDKTSKNPDSSGYRQAYFVCEKRENIVEKKRIILLNELEHNYEICLEATKFSTTIRKFDQNDLGLIEKLSDNGLRTKDI
ncbi:21103_t:CDS:2, partial [Gigaspora margarita]